MTSKNDSSLILHQANIGDCHETANQFASSVSFIGLIDRIIAIGRSMPNQEAYYRLFVGPLAKHLGAPQLETPEDFRRIVVASIGGLIDLKTFPISWQPEAAAEFLGNLATSPWMDSARITIRLNTHEEIGYLPEVPIDEEKFTALTDSDRMRMLAVAIIAAHDIAPMLLDGLLRKPKSAEVEIDGISTRTAYIDALTRLQYFVCTVRDAADVGRAIAEEGVKCEIVTLGPVLASETLAAMVSGRELPAAFGDKAMFRAILTPALAGQFSEADIEQFFPDDRKKGAPEQAAPSPSHQVNTSATGNAPSASAPKSELSAIPKRTKQNDEQQR